MGIPYDTFVGAFLSKISEFELLRLPDENRTKVVDGYLKRAVGAFRKNCKYNLVSAEDDEHREFILAIDDSDLDELIDIISEGMVVQWLKPYAYRQESLENTISSRDWQTYSPADLLMRVGKAYEKAQKDYTQMIREYSYNHGDLSDLHL